MSMDVVTEQQHRALAFVSACESSGYRPTPAELAGWLNNPTPRSAVHSQPSWFSYADVFARMSFAVTGWEGEVVEPEETVAEHLVRIHWLKLHDDDRLGLTRLGAALHAAVGRAMLTETATTVVVLGKDDPLAYPSLIAVLSEAADGFLLDPYIKVNQLFHLIQHTKIKRVLVKKMRSTESALAAMSVLLSGPNLPRQLEVRCTEDPKFHDRWIVGADGTVKTIGASMNAVQGGTPTVISPIPECAVAGIVAQSQAWWAAATPLWPETTGEPPEPAAPVASAKRRGLRRQEKGGASAQTDATGPD